MPELTFELFALLIGAAFAAGFIDAIAGGGGLITLPALMLAGVPPVAALATNKTQGVFGAATSALSYAAKGHVNLRRQMLPALLSFAAGLVGAFCATRIPSDVLRLGLPALMIAIALFFALKPGLNDTDRVQRIEPRTFAVAFVPVIGFYDGLLGPGAGSFFMLGFVMLAGFGVLKATAHTKLLNFASNLGGLTAFAIAGSPIWKLGLMMGAASICGAWLGARVAMRNGARIIKPLLVLTSTLMALRLIWQMI